MIASAIGKGLKITAGHDDQFRHVARRMRVLIQDGFLGGGPVHMESYYCYELGGSGYAKALLGDKHHWVRKLPGKLLHNIISHGIARIAEFLTGDSPQVIACGFMGRPAGSSPGGIAAPAACAVCWVASRPNSAPRFRRWTGQAIRRRSA